VKFQPLSEDEVVQRSLLRSGKYSFEVVEAKEETSAAGNEMFHLQVNILLPGGNGKIVHDYLLPQRMEKFRHAAEAMGLLEKFDTGVLSADDFPGRKGKCKLGIERDREGYYPTKNVIVDYLA
jgi:hypothetical protein